jgi:hypothetical protein
MHQIRQRTQTNTRPYFTCGGLSSEEMNTFKEIFEKTYGEGSLNDEFTINALSAESLALKYALNQYQTVVMKSGEVFEGKVFESIEQARNYIKFKYPRRRFKEETPNVFTCTRYGTMFGFIKLTKY